MEAYAPIRQPERKLSTQTAALIIIIKEYE
jgi:hypothetical protein